MGLSTVVLSSLLVGTAEWTLTANAVDEASAFLLAESGVEHALLALDSAESDPETILLGPDGDAGTADDGVLLGDTSIGNGGTYSARMVDNDDGDSDLMVDADGIVYLFADGTIDTVSKAVRLVLSGNSGGSWTPPYGVLTKNKIFLASGVELRGSGATVFANDDVVIDNDLIEGLASSNGSVDIQSSSPTIAGETLTGSEITDYEAANSGQPETTIPEIDPADFEPLAEYTLADDGKVYRPDGSVEFDTDDGSDMWGSWKYEGSGDWTLDGPSSSDEGAFYVEGSVKVAGSGGSSGNPVELSLFAEGSVEFAGDFYITGRIPHVLAVTGGDVFISGMSEYTGSLLVHEQLKTNGSSTIFGSVVVEDEDDDWDLLSRYSNGTEFGDNTVIWPQPNTLIPVGSAGWAYQVLEWREEY